MQQPIYRLADLLPKDNRITLQKLLVFYEKNGKFPAPYRPLIWRYLLKLPENIEIFTDLASRGIHPVYQDITETHGMKQDPIQKPSQLKSICSLLAHWSPIFAEVCLFFYLLNYLTTEKSS